MFRGLRRRLLELLHRRPGPLGVGWTAKQVGDWGEDWAAWHYFHDRGAAVLARNWRGGGGELDLVVREGWTLVFVEVKTRDPADPEPLAAVRDSRRRRRFRSAADAWVSRLRKPRPAIRFDVVLVTPDPANPATPQIDCLVDVLGEQEEDPGEAGRRWEEDELPE
jgi:putative endonuclease